MADIESYENALDAIPGAHPYPRSSRYHDAEIGIHRQPDGTEVRYTKRRLLPPLDQPGQPGQLDQFDRPGDEGRRHTVGSGDRPDLLGQRYYGDPAQWWQIADANPVLDPRELTDEAGKVIEVPLPGSGGERRV
ncbi:LysM peptidoglycan-binding domain-containing protein [Streptomyces sp. NPDC059517]|uniref:LysM peptidoglycan-binding domain-containing protein n=1 Tax=Streptomyces sp. NPDC059517 TaxID=3346855 RepID=UPI0036A8BE49